MTDTADDHCRVCGVALYLDDLTDPATPLWLDGDGEYPTCREGDPHIPRSW
ncbi:hypothetical protein [Actinomycetospora flava]|uniref:Uncharacterized protein n=1 Tax=Actinomycetospora flava TaxID=3129232 RepID=A0ABU8MCL1_9PSEU